MQRIMDCLIAMVVLILTWPILLVCMAAVGLYMGRPIFFKQQRPGFKQKPFVLYKLRTMHVAEKDATGQVLSDTARLSKLGQWLRKYSLDELPQLWNVLKGDLSLVGPRPLLMEYLPLYTPRQARRHDVRPGITGWAQVNGRNALSWEEKFELDVWYVEHRSFWLNLKILALTALRVVRAQDIGHQSLPTMEKFTGTK